MKPVKAAGLAGVVVVLAVAFGRLLSPFDLLTFLRAGRDVLHGHSPYAAPGSPVFRSGHAFVYPLYVAWLFAPLGALPVALARWIFSVGSVAAILVSCRLLGRPGAGTAALVMVSSTTIIALQMGTLNALLLLGLSAAWHWREERPWLSGIILGAAATAKLFLLPVLLWPLLKKRYGQAAAALGSAAGLMLLSAALGWTSPVSYVQMMSKLDSREQVSSWSLSSFLQALGLGRLPSAAGAVAIALTGAAVVWWHRRRLGDGQLLGAAVVISLLLSPIVWSSYLLLLVLPLLLATRDDRLLALFAVATWAIVTPDAATTPRVAVGVTLAAAVALSVARPRRLIPVGRAVRAAANHVGPVAPVLAWLGILMLVAPTPARSPLPALGAIAAVAACCLRGPRGTQALTMEPSTEGQS